MTSSSRDPQTVTTGYWCATCNDLIDPAPVYECQNCGSEGTERRCEDCHRFAARREEDGCETCLAEPEEVDVVTDHDGTLIRLCDYRPEGPAYAERRRAEDEADRARSKAEKARRVSEMLAGTAATTWRTVTVGTEFVGRDWQGNPDTISPVRVLSLLTAGPGAQPPLTPGAIVATVHHYGIRTEVHAPDEEVHVFTGTARTADTAAAERFTVGDCSAIMGSGLTLLEVAFTPGGPATNGVPVGEITGRHSAYSNSLTRIATFTDPREARAFARTVRRVAADARLTGSGHAAPVTERTGTYIDAAPVRYAAFEVGPFEYEGDGDHGVEITVGSSPRSGSSFRIADASVLTAIADAAETIASRLETVLDTTGN